MAYIDNVTNILQIQPDGLPTFVRLSQNENGRNLYFQLAGNEIDIPANSTITISGTKPDGTVYSGTGSISDNVILIPEMIQMTAVAGYWDAKVKIISGGNTIATGRIRFVIDADTVDPDSVPSDSELEGLVAEAQQYAETARTEAYGSPLTAQTAAGMTDHTRAYVYTGSETGYTAGHWYYWDGTQWTDGGIYNSTAVNTDPTLTLAGVAADAKATGDAIEAARVAIDDTLTNEGEAADAAAVGSEISGLKEDLSAITVNAPNLKQFFYKANTYINNSGVETTLNGYDTYKIPCEAGQIIRISWENLSEAPWQGIEVGYAWKIFKSDDTFIQIKAQSSNNGYIYANNKEGIAICPSNAMYATFMVKHGNESGVSVQKNIPYETVNAYDKVSYNNVVHTINESNAIKTQYYFNQSTQTFAVMGAAIKALMFRVYTGDVIEFTTIRSGVSMRAGFRADDGTMTSIGTIIASPFIYTANTDGVIAVYYLAAESGDAVYKPKNQIKIEAKNVVGLSDGTQFSGLSGVAFGTSLTYNATVGNGYLTRLSSLSGITFDNQGVGSSTILGDGGSLDMLAKIKAYTGYSSKRVCILEGFVNDWYTNKTLGTWQDTGETTVCGCVRSALNYMLTQNANMTVFLILDHYGRHYNSLDCSTTHKNASNLTQFEFYSEIEKIANSLGVPVICEFKLSGISELMPQYLADNIHLNALGAIQSANVIWNEMKQHPLNVE